MCVYLYMNSNIGGYVLAVPFSLNGMSIIMIWYAANGHIFVKDFHMNRKVFFVHLLIPLTWLDVIYVAFIYFYEAPNALQLHFADESTQHTKVQTFLPFVECAQTNFS